MKMVENTKEIRISTLENRSPYVIEEWIAMWNDENETVNITGNVITIGEIEYVPLKWKCPDCGRWNYELTYWDNAGAGAICDHCKKDNEF